MERLAVVCNERVRVRFNWHANNKTVRRAAGKGDGDGRAQVSAVAVCGAATAPFLKGFGSTSHDVVFATGIVEGL